MNQQTDATYHQWDDEYVWHPFTPMEVHRAEHPPIISHAEGFWLYDIAGNKYLDGISSLWCNVHGHRVPEIDQAIRDQLDRVAHTTLLGLGSIPSIELAKKLVELAPEGLNKVFYSDSGSTAVEAALKIIYQYHRQKKNPEERSVFLGLSQAYHGDTVGSVSLGGIQLFHQLYGGLLFKSKWLPSPGLTHVPSFDSEDQYHKWCFKEVEKILEAHANDIAAVVIEPIVQGAAGILVHPPGYLKHVRELTQKYGIPLIADEVAVGLGRTGTMFACEQEDVVPDILCIAKGLTGGYLPVAATLVSDEIYNTFLGPPSAGKTFFHGHTFTGNALGCAAALASLKLYEEHHILENVRVQSEWMAARLKSLLDHPHVSEIRQKGMMVGIELVAEKTGHVAYTANLRVGHQVTLAARRLGLVIRPLGDVVVAMPGLAMQREDLEFLCQNLIDAICEVTLKLT
jgi:adenosylmethionine-8-amino-7-oxononanoate aminotransferase